MIIVSFGMNDGGGLSNTLTAGTFYQELLSFHNEFSTGCIINYMNDIAPKDTTTINTSDIFYRNKVSLAQEMRDFANTNRTINFFDSFRLSHLLQFGVDEKAYTIDSYNVTDSYTRFIMVQLRYHIKYRQPRKPLRLISTSGSLTEQKSLCFVPLTAHSL